mmetsp:Transcript_29887/g.91742  ORF Transcript_29887/g.91742 Transcript_29887/m.91742 type:complete len:276 (+) Transcript_29887:33-860(+)
MRAASSPSWAALYSLLHLNGFPGDSEFYRSACTPGSRVLELGAGEGRIGEALCKGGALREYVGVELCAEFVQSASARLAAYEGARVVQGDMLVHSLEAHHPYDVVLLTSNTFFCTPSHQQLLKRCHDALRPGGMFLFDIYNARDWHEEAMHESEVGGAVDPSANNAAAEVDDDEEEDGDVLVMAMDADGREWTVYERDPEVDAEARIIRCTYEFEAATGERASQVNEHFYILPAEVDAMLDATGFDVESVHGGFEREPFDEDESIHVVYAARKRG